MLHGGLYRQCRGGDVIVLHGGLYRQCRGGDVIVLHGGLYKQCRGGDVIVLHGGLYRQCRGEWKLASVSAVPVAFEVTYCMVCCGRPSSRPYSYAVERWCDLQCIIMDCPCRYIVGIDVIFNAPSWIVHADTSWVLICFQRIIKNCPDRQCRGEWKLARVAFGDDVYVAASPPGIDRVSSLHVLRATFQSPLQLRGGALT